MAHWNGGSATRMLSRSLIHSPARLSWRRSLATATAEHPPPSPNLSSPIHNAKPSSRPRISTAVILNRSPILTRSLSPFEQAYHAYQARIRRALHNPFPTEFYFKQGSLLEARFGFEEKDRETLAFGSDFVRDDYVDPEKAAADRAAVEQLAEQEGEGEQIASRESSPEVNANRQSLDRQGERNLYLLLKTKQEEKDVWRFPQGGLEKGDLLHQAAQKDLYAECGEAMDTWIVSRSPVGVYKQAESSEEATTSDQHIVFFFKAHIMAGQVQPQSKSVKDFAWLTKEEIQPLVDSQYWAGVKDILSDY